MHFRTGLRGKLKNFIESRGNSNRITFDGAGISKEMFDWILEQVPEKETVIEFGAGYSSTKALSAVYKLYSVEHNPMFIDLYDSNYILAPIDHQYGWYDLSQLQILRELNPKLVLVDGPPGTGNRFGILKNLDLIEKAEYIVIDDTNRASERLLAELMSMLLNREITQLENWSYLTRKKVVELQCDEVQL